MAVPRPILSLSARPPPEVIEGVLVAEVVVVEEGVETALETS